ncbi:unnamed protein product, partial [Rotaria sordida]
FYTYGIAKPFRQHVFEAFQQETLCDHEVGQLYGFRVDGASFSQQFFSTKSNYTFEAITAAVAKNNDTLNSLKPNGEQYLNGAHIFSSGFRFI